MIYYVCEIVEREEDFSW